MSEEKRLRQIFEIRSASRVQDHYDGAKRHLTNSNEVLRRTSHEQDLYAQYVAQGEAHGPTIYSSKGEHYTEVCPSLKRFLDNELKFDLKSFGYMEFKEKIINRFVIYTHAILIHKNFYLKNHERLTTTIVPFEEQIDGSFLFFYMEKGVEIKVAIAPKQNNFLIYFEVPRSINPMSDPMGAEEPSIILLKRPLVKFITFDIWPTESNVILSPGIL